MQLQITRPLAFIDLETTGTDTAKDRIVEIAVLKISPDGSKALKSERINPGTPIPEQASLIHGIYDKDVKDAPAFSKIAKDYFIFLNDCDLSGFNSSRFDYPILIEEFLRVGMNFSMEGRRHIDVQRIFHLMEKRNLEAAYKFYCGKILNGAHSAKADAEAAYEVLMSQLDRYPDNLKNDIDFLHDLTKDGDFVDMNRRMVFINGEPAINFGKHKGKTIKQLLKTEPQYFDWIFKSDFPLEFKQKLKDILDELNKK
jgi:DNA polymerase-3 subunit epsilon